MAKFLSKYGKFYMREGKLLRPTNILEVPIVTTNLTYNGTAQSPTIYGYDSNKMTMSGVTSAINPGSYTTTFTPKDGYCWADDTTTAKSVTWKISKAAGALSLSTNSLILGNEAGSFTVNRVGDGAIQATSSDTSVATVDVSGDTVTVNRAVGKTWLLEDNLGPSDGSFEANFVSNNKRFTAISSEAMKNRVHYYNGSNITRVCREGWSDDGYRILTFDEVPTGALLTWLQENGTQYSETWVINETPTITSSVNGSAACKLTLSDGTTYQSSYFIVDASGGKVGQYISANIGTGENMIYGVNSIYINGWYDSGCRTITFLEPPTGDLLTWLQANAVKQEEPVIITVTVGEGTNYKAVTSGETCVVTFAEGVSVPTQSGGLTYNGSAQYPTWSNYDPNKMTIGGTTSATNAGTYTATFTLKAGYGWAGGSTATRSVAWTIYKATIAAVPTQSGSLTYNGSAQYPSWSNYDSNKMTIGGTTSAVNVGTYTATFTPTANYRWPDWTTTAKNVTWTIGKIAGSLSLSTSSMTIDTNSTTGSFTVTRAGDGAISASSNNTGVATVSVSGNTVTVTKVRQGSATITVSVAEGTNHTAPASKTCTVTCKADKPVGSLAVGSSVYMNVNGVRTEFIVVNQGNPNTSVYDSSCDGTWLLMKDIYQNRQWHRFSDNDYANSVMHSYLNSTYLALFDSNIQNAIK